MARKKAPAGKIGRLRDLVATSYGRVLVRVTLASLVFLLAGIVMRQARAYTYRMDDFRVGPKNIAFADLPTWADQRVLYYLQPHRISPFSVSIYDPDAEALIGSRLRRHPMVRDVAELKVLYPNGVRCVPILRVPVAWVSVWEDDHRRGQVQRSRHLLLSGDGCLLPTEPYQTCIEQLSYPLPVVRGITETPPRRLGEVWEDRLDRVAEAVSCARLAARLHRDFSGQVMVKTIDVSRFTPTGRARDEGEVRLTLSCPPTRKVGTRVQRIGWWGRSERAGTDVSHEAPYLEKIERLRGLLTSARPARELDVRHPISELGRTPE